MTGTPRLESFSFSLSRYVVVTRRDMNRHFPSVRQNTYCMTSFSIETYHFEVVGFFTNRNKRYLTDVS